ncbi:unnamed protein product [Paramecium sonneborni]|uniref:Calmodulin n=1 Tax=Paramecium sonneborni TaxID=65129 RepID=A0A8S1R7F6_9CILI|nr:unnamed protein product [Paramecium sonneborni]
MINQTKTQLFEVFKKFDKDGNGYVESNELIEISKQMNEEITQDDIDRLMKVVDSNNDGKISFEEFWIWWQFGKNEKLEKLVFMKLKLMNMLKSINSEFTRFGVSLEQKYEPKLDHHYWAINYGDFQPHFKFNIKMKYKGSGVLEDIQQEVGFQQSKSLQIIIICRAIKPVQAKEKLEQLWKEFKQKLQEKQDQIILPQIENSLNIEFQERKDSVAIAINISHALIDMTFEQAYLPYCEKLGTDVEVLIQSFFLIRYLLNIYWKDLFLNLKQLLIVISQKVNWCYFGQFWKIICLKNRCNKIIIENIIRVYMAYAFQEFQVSFIIMEDVNQFLNALGLQELADEQPTAIYNNKLYIY